MSSRQQNAWLVLLSTLLFAQIACFFLNACANFSAAASHLTFVGYKGARLVSPVIQVDNIVFIGLTLTCFYAISCLVFFFLLVGLWSRKPIYFHTLLALDGISLFLGLYGYYFWITGGVAPTSGESVITLVEPFLSSGGLILLMGVPAIRDLWWPRRREHSA